jgi:hypothetical protein
VKKMMEPLVLAKKLTKEDSQWVLAKTTNKVLEANKDKVESKEFMSQKQKGKIRDLVDKYVKIKLKERKPSKH